MLHRPVGAILGSLLPAMPPRNKCMRHPLLRHHTHNSPSPRVTHHPLVLLLLPLPTHCPHLDPDRKLMHCTPIDNHNSSNNNNNRTLCWITSSPILADSTMSIFSPSRPFSVCTVPQTLFIYFLISMSHPITLFPSQCVCVCVYPFLNESIQKCCIQFTMSRFIDNLAICVFALRSTFFLFISEFYFLPEFCMLHV